MGHSGHVLSACGRCLDPNLHVEMPGLGQGSRRGQLVSRLLGGTEGGRRGLRPRAHLATRGTWCCGFLSRPLQTPKWPGPMWPVRAQRGRGWACPGAVRTGLSSPGPPHWGLPDCWPRSPASPLLWTWEGTTVTFPKSSILSGGYGGRAVRDEDERPGPHSGMPFRAPPAAPSPPLAHLHGTRPAPAPDGSLPLPRYPVDACDPPPGPHNSPHFLEDMRCSPGR